MMRNGTIHSIVLVQIFTNRWGTTKYLRNGRHHRMDGPALIYRDGAEEWLRDGIHHRADGPAIIDANGNQFWFQHGRLHREDGPAVINERQQFWIDGHRISQEEFEARTQ